jgi:hypothetical protein
MMVTEVNDKRSDGNLKEQLPVKVHSYEGGPAEFSRKYCTNHFLTVANLDG